ncbi:hypothetical protein BDR03DRAFT_955096, partial [Suillus americanus]
TLLFIHFKATVDAWNVDGDSKYEPQMVERPTPSHSSHGLKVNHHHDQLPTINFFRRRPQAPSSVHLDSYSIEHNRDVVRLFDAQYQL